MIDVREDLWRCPADARVITTNGETRKDGRAVMGAGVAKTAVERYAGLDVMLGAAIRRSGNRVYSFFCAIDGGVGGTDTVITFPTKHHWRDGSDLELIETSCKQLVDLADMHDRWLRIVMPRPGCGRGGLSYSDVRPILERHLDDRFHVCS